MMYYKPLKSPAGCMVLKWRLGAKFISIATCAEVELRVQFTATCVDEEWNLAQYSLVMQLV